MTRTTFDRDALRRIAHEAMEDRGLLPEFSAAVVAETNRISNESPSGSRCTIFTGTKPVSTPSHVVVTRARSPSRTRCTRSARCGPAGVSTVSSASDTR